MAVLVRLVPADFKIGKEALHCFIECDAVRSKLVVFKVILKVGGDKTIPILPRPTALHKGATHA